jgi:hypothetical protein
MGEVELVRTELRNSSAQAGELLEASAAVEQFEVQTVSRLKANDTSASTSPQRSTRATTASAPWVLATKSSHSRV